MGEMFRKLKDLRDHIFHSPFPLPVSNMYMDPQKFGTDLYLLRTKCRF